jgi:hypothetical protein
MNPNRKMKMVFASMGLLVAMSTSGAALATDAKSFPGAACLTQTETTPFVRDLGQMQNASKAFEYWSCPFVRDTFPDYGLESAFVWVINNSDHDELCCTIAFRNGDGTLVDSQRKCAGYSPNPQSITFNAMTSGSGGGHYSMRCEVPAMNGSLMSGVVSYTYNEP